MSRAGRMSVVVLAGAAVLILSLLAGAFFLAQAAFADRATVRADVGASAFEVALLDGDAVIQRVSRTSDGPSVEFGAAENAVPGSTVQIPLTIANNSAFGVAPRISLRVASDELERIDRLVRVTVVETDACAPGGDEDRRVLAGDLEDFAQGTPLADVADGIAGTVMEARSGDAQRVGQQYSGGDAACRSYDAYLHLSDDPSLRALAGASWTITADIEGRTEG